MLWIVNQSINLYHSHGDDAFRGMVLHDGLTGPGGGDWGLVSHIIVCVAQVRKCVVCGCGAPHFQTLCACLYDWCTISTRACVRFGQIVVHIGLLRQS